MSQSSSGFRLFRICLSFTCPAVINPFLTLFYFFFKLSLFPLVFRPLLENKGDLSKDGPMWFSFFPFPSAVTLCPSGIFNPRLVRVFRPATYFGLVGRHCLPVNFSVTARLHSCTLPSKVESWGWGEKLLSDRVPQEISSPSGNKCLRLERNQTALWSGLPVVKLSRYHKKSIIVCLYVCVYIWMCVFCDWVISLFSPFVLPKDACTTELREKSFVTSV